MKKDLIFITLAWNQDDVLLRHTLEWVYESAKHFNRVSVYATHVNGVDSNKTNRDFEIHEIGGGSGVKRIVGAIKLLTLSLRLTTKRDRYAVFYHMNVLPILIMGTILRLAGIPQGLWYSHAVSGVKLKIAEKLVNHCFSTAIETFPLTSRKTHGIGHGLDKSWEPKEICSQRENTILIVGRINRVKRIKDVILASSRICENRPTIRLIGQIQEKAYLNEIFTLATELKVDVEYVGELKREELKSELYRGSMIYSGTNGSVDKAALEGGISGCFIVSHNPTVLTSSGQYEVIVREFEVNLVECSLQTQIAFYLKINERTDIRNQISKECFGKNSLANLMCVVGNFLNNKE